jgi:sec-independent protein translocase protein TatA
MESEARELRGLSLQRVSPMGSMSLWHWIVVIGVVLLLFGRGKISELMGDVAQGIKAFKKGMSEDDSATNDTPKIEPGKTEAKTLDQSPAGGAKSHVS